MDVCNRVNGESYIVDKVSINISKNPSTSMPENDKFCTSSISALEFARQLANGQDNEDLSDGEDNFLPVLTCSEAEVICDISNHAIRSSSDRVNHSNKHFSSMVGRKVSVTDGLIVCELKRDEESDVEEDASSCLGSSVTCSEASFELGRKEDFEPHSVASNFVPDNNNESTGNSPENLQINDRSSAQNGSSLFSTASTTAQKNLEEQKTDQCVNVVEGNAKIKGDDANPIFSSVNGQEEECDSNTVDYSYDVGKLVIATAIAEGGGSERFSSSCSVSKNKAVGHYDRNFTKFEILVNNSEKIVGSSEQTNAEKDIRLNDIENELANLDTNMPELNFDQLQKHLQNAVEEREKTQRELHILPLIEIVEYTVQILSEEVRRRLAFDDSEDKMSDFDVDVARRTFNSNNRLKHKLLNAGMEICFVNDGLPSEEEEDDFEDEDSITGVPKSLSTPNLGYGKQCSEDYRSLERSASSSGDSEKRASDLRRDALARQAIEDSDGQTRKIRLEREAKVMLTKAKQAARMQMELEKQLKVKRSRSNAEKIVGVALGKRKLIRPQLSKMCITQLLIIINDLHARIQSYNEELVHLLIERDTLHMEQDSMLVDVQDLIQHQRQDDVKVPDFVAKLIDLSVAANNGLRKQFSFKLLKKVIPSISKD